MLDEEGARLMKARGTYFAPTLYVGHAILNDNQALNIPAHQVEREKAMRGTQEKAFAIALAYKLPIAFATDAGVFPHGENAREFKLRTDLGQTPMAAIEPRASRPRPWAGPTAWARCSRASSPI